VFHGTDAVNLFRAAVLSSALGLLKVGITRTMVTMLLVALAVAFSHQSRAGTCEQFAARAVEGAAIYNMPTPEFTLVHVNEADPDDRYFDIMFGDFRTLMMCWHGSVSYFAADARDSSEASSARVSLLMVISLYADGLAWNEAISLRDALVREARSKDAQNKFPMAERTIDGVRASLIVSSAGPSFVIEVKGE
jgi:hypothetical protein